MKHPECRTPLHFPGYRSNGFTNSPNSGIVFATLKPSEERNRPDLTANAIAADLNKQYGLHSGSVHTTIFPPPPVQGLGTVSRVQLYIEDRSGMGLESLYKETTSTLQKGNKLRGCGSFLQLRHQRTANRFACGPRAKTYGFPRPMCLTPCRFTLGSL